MISTNDFKTGITIELDNGLWQIVEFLHVKPGKGAAFVRSKLKNVETGQVLEKTFRAGEKMPVAHLEKRDMQFLFMDGSELTVMDMQTFDQMNLSKDQVGDSILFLKENMIVSVMTHNGKVIGVDLPNFVELEVVDTPPAEKGNTAQGGTKPAVLESGATVQVPFFVVNGTKVRVDTRTKQYLDRV